jgi:hypothetical protein
MYVTLFISEYPSHREITQISLIHDQPPQSSIVSAVRGSNPIDPNIMIGHVLCTADMDRVVLFYEAFRGSIARVNQHACT